MDWSKQHDLSVKNFGNIGCYTNLSLNKSTDQMILWKEFNQVDYPEYDNYFAFECGKVADIPITETINVKIKSSCLSDWKKFYEDDLTVLSKDDDVAVVNIYHEIIGVPITFLDKYNPSSHVKDHNLAI